MSTLKLFCDGSADPKTGIGFGACLLISPYDTSTEELPNRIHLQRFEATNAARLELQTLLWALKELIAPATDLTIHSDSQTICQLPQRQQRLEANNFCSAQGRPLNNADLYREFYRLLPKYKITICKQSGHLPGAERTLNDQIFRLVDKAARGALRQERQQSK